MSLHLLLSSKQLNENNLPISHRVKREKGVISNLPLSADRLIIKYLSLFSQIALCELIFLSLLSPFF
jgi:hypothetical protein